MASTSADGDELGALTGWLYLIDEQKHRTTDRIPYDTWGAVLRIVKKVREADKLPWRSSDGRLAILKNLESEFLQKSWAEFQIKICRDGTAEISPSEKTQSIRGVVSFDVDGEDSYGSALDYVANQAFFFLKDISHTHQHHNATLDTINTVSHSDRLNSWVSETTYKFHKKVMKLRQSKDPRTLMNALGFLSYISSFTKVTSGKIKPNNKTLIYNISDIENSIKSRLELAKWRQTQINILKTALPAVTLAVLAFNKDAGITAFLRASLESLFPNRFGAWILATIVIAQVPFYYQVWNYHDIWLLVQARRILYGIKKTSQAAFWMIAMFVSVFPVLAYLILSPRGIVIWQLWVWAALGLGLSFAGLLALPYVITLGDVYRLKFTKKKLAESAQQNRLQ